VTILINGFLRKNKPDEFHWLSKKQTAELERMNLTAPDFEFEPGALTLDFSTLSANLGVFNFKL